MSRLFLNHTFFFVFVMIFVVAGLSAKPNFSRLYPNPDSSKTIAPTFDFHSPPGLAASYSEQEDDSDTEAQEECKQKELIDGLRSIRMTLRYTSPRGIGYNPGYTTIEGFFAPPYWMGGSWIPFLDVRNHIFDNGKFAANVGAGLRYLSLGRIWGGNAYYDYRNAGRFHCNQIAIGFETLGEDWDVRVNGYFPVGKSKSDYFHVNFAYFKEHSLFIRASRDFAMTGFNAEAEYHWDYFEQAPCYIAGGPYYLTGNGEAAWGGQLRYGVDLCRRFLRVEGNLSYDHLFKWIGQGAFSVNIPLGKQCRSVRKEGEPCSKTSTLCLRGLQRVDRFEIIPVDRKRSAQRAINPITGEPWFFWFVDNLSNSLGTYESPFPMLVQAQNASHPNQGIYVFPGDGSTTGMDMGMTLQNGQYFLGASVSHAISTTLGSIVIPSMAASMPKITNLTSNSTVVALANNNTISGFSITAQGITGIAVEGTNISGLVLDRNILTAFKGLSFGSISGGLVIKQNAFVGGLNSNSSNVNLSGLFSCLNVINNVFVSSNRAGIDNTATIETMNISGNSFEGANGILNDSGTISTLNVFGNSFNSTATSCIYNTVSGILGDVNASNNIFAGIRGIFSSTTMHALNASHNTFNNLTNEGIRIQNVLQNAVVISDNSFNGVNSAPNPGILIAPSGATNNVTFQIMDNTFSPVVGASTGYAAQINLLAPTTACLDLTGNTAPDLTPGAYAYSLTAAGGATFNRTSASTDANNSGGITTTNVNAPGSCSVP